jgi:hypothetical protein
MALWDPTTHMSKVEWRQTCQRTAYGVELAAEPTPEVNGDAEPQKRVRHSAHHKDASRRARLARSAAGRGRPE